MTFSNSTKGILCIISGVLINLVLGSFYVWGSINLYVASYFKKNNLNPNLTPDVTNFCFPIMALAFNIAPSFGLKIKEKIGIKRHCWLFSCILCICVFMSSFSNSFWLFVLIYGIGFGLTSGLIYLIPLYNAYKYFPQKKGMLTGIIMGGYGLGTFISSLIFLKMVNPSNDKIGADGDFTKEVADNFPIGLQTISYYFAILLFVGCVLLQEYKGPLLDLSLESQNGNEDVTNKNEGTRVVAVSLVENPANESEIVDENKCLREKLLDKEYQRKDIRTNCVSLINVNNLMKQSEIINEFAKSELPSEQNSLKPKSIKDVIKSKAFYSIILMIYLSSSTGFYFASNFKGFGMTIDELKSDAYLTLVGSLSALSNGFGRIFWGLMMDRFNFKRVYALLLALQMILLSTLFTISNNSYIYGIWICGFLLCLGGHFVLFPPLAIKVFGNKIGPKIYGFMMIIFFFANMTQFLINLYLKQVLGYEYVFWTFFGFSILSGIVLLASRLKY